MVLSFCILLFVIGLWVYRIYTQYIFHYFLIWIFFFPVLFNIFHTIEEEDYWKIITWTIYLSYAIVLLDILRFGIDNKWIQRILFLVGGIIAYYSALSFFRGTGLIASMKYITGSLGFVVSLSIIRYKECDVGSLLRLIRFIVFFEILLALFQPFTDTLNFHVALNGDDVMTAMVNGTFIRNNVFVEILTPLVMILVYHEYRVNEKITPRMVLVVTLMLWLIYYSSVRTALVGILPISIIVFYMILGNRFKTRKGRIFVFLFFLLSMYVVYSFVQNMAEETGVTYTQNAKDSSERQAVLLSMLNDSDFAEEQTTLGLSYIVLYSLPDNPLFGPGKLLQSGGYGGFISRENGNDTDATLAIYICETGIIGVLLLLIVYYIVLKKVGNNNILSNLIFLFLSLITIADAGLFFIGNMIPLFISMQVSDFEPNEECSEV